MTNSFGKCSLGTHSVQGVTMPSVLGGNEPLACWDAKPRVHGVDENDVQCT